MVEGASIPAQAAVDPKGEVPEAAGLPAVVPRAAGIPSDPTILFTQETRIRNITGATIPARVRMAGTRGPARVAAGITEPRGAGIAAVHRVAARPTSGMPAICVAPSTVPTARVL